MDELKQQSKFNSRRFILAILCLIIILAGIICCCIRDNYQLVPVLTTLSAAPTAFISFETLKKKWVNDGKA